MGHNINTSGLKGIIATCTQFNPDTLTTGDDWSTGPHGGGVGVPAPSRSTAPVLASVSGIADDQDNPIIVEVLKSGNPGLGDGALQVGYRFVGDVAEDVRGWTAPDCIKDFIGLPLAVATLDSSDAAVAASGRIYIALKPNATRSVLSVYDPGIDQVFSTSVAGPLTDIPHEGVAVAIDDSSILYWLEQDSLNVWRMFRKSALGFTSATWDLVAYEPFDTKPTATPDKLRMLILPSGEWALFELTDTGANLTITQWASSDRGASWTRVGTDTATFQGMGDVCLTGSGKIGLSVTDGTTCRFYTAATAWTDITVSGTASAVSTVDVLVAESWTCLDPCGRLWSVVRDSASTSSLYVSFSDDDGASWDYAGSVGHVFDFNSSAAAYYTGGKLVFSYGSLFLMHASNTSTALNLTRMGGWENVQYTYGSGGGTGIDNCSTWTSFCLPSAVAAWTAGGAGTATLGSGTGLTTIATTFAGAQHKNYTAAVVPATGASAQVTCEFKFKVDTTSTGTISANNHGTKIWVSDATNRSGIQIWASKTQFAVVDEVGSNLITVTWDMVTYPTQFRVHVQMDGPASVYYKYPYSTLWNLAYETSVVTNSVGTTGAVVFGHSTAPASGTATSKWYYLWYAAVTAVSTADTNPRSRLVPEAQQQPLQGKQLTSVPSPIGEWAGTSAGLGLTAADGPAVQGELYAVYPRYDHPMTAVFPTVSPSPRNTWVSPDASSSSYFDFSLDEAINMRSLGLGLLNTTASTAILYGWSSGAWTTVGTWNGAFATAMTYTLTGNILKITSAIPSYVWRNMLVGGHVVFSADSASVYPIASHTEGVTGSVSAKHAEFVLSDVTTSTPTSSGTVTIYAPSGVLVLHNQTATYRRWRVSIPGYSVQVGNMVLGPLITAGQQMSRGWTAQYQRNALQTESRDLVSRVKRLGPVRRSWTWPYTDPMDQSQLRGFGVANPTPDYLDPTNSGEALANFRDVPYLWSGVLEELKSGEVPVIALNPIPAVSGTMVLDPTQFLYGRVASDVGVEHVLGKEGRDEVLRMGPLTFTEIV